MPLLIKYVSILTLEDFKKNYKELLDLAEEEITRGDISNWPNKNFINAQTICWHVNYYS